MKYVTTLLVAAALAADPGPAAEPRVATALATPEGTLFESPMPIDWDSLAPAHLRSAALGADPAGRRRLFDRRTDYGTDATFPAPLPARLRALHYYLLDSAGIRSFRPDGLLGRVGIDWDRIAGADTDRIVSHRVGGQVRTRIRPVGNGGFVLIDAAPLRLAVEASAVTADSLLGPGGADYPHRGAPFRGIVRQYQVRDLGPGGRRWIWVQWPADTAGVEGYCTIRLSLFRLGGAPAEVSSLDAACDP